MNRREMETDVVVIGSGVTGLAAALTAAEGGAKVIVFEKQRSLGGSSNFFYGTFAVESEMQRKGTLPTVSQAFISRSTAIGGPARVS
jgi:fumarate reductase flavoprotein subunit